MPLVRIAVPQGAPTQLISRRGLRGGSWDDGQDLARSACRFGGYSGGGDVPLRRVGVIGFRVVCSSPPNNTDR